MSSIANPGEVGRFGFPDDNFDEKTRVLVEFVMRYAFYAALVAILLMIVALIVKLIWNFDEGSGSIGESTRLLFDKSNIDGKLVTLYGTNEGDELESGRGTASSDDWYDGKICVICYEFPRNCFFIPCGHCVSCINCAHRIINEEIKSCPICRGIIDRVRKLRVS